MPRASLTVLFFHMAGRSTLRVIELITLVAIMGIVVAVIVPKLRRTQAAGTGSEKAQVRSAP